MNDTPFCRATALKFRNRIKYRMMSNSPLFPGGCSFFGGSKPAPPQTSLTGGQTASGTALPLLRSSVPENAALPQSGGLQSAGRAESLFLSDILPWYCRLRLTASGLHIHFYQTTDGRVHCLAGQAAKLSQLVLSKWCGMFICFCFTEAVKNGKCSIRKMTGRCIGVV